MSLQPFELSAITPFDGPLTELDACSAQPSVSVIARGIPVNGDMATRAAISIKTKTCKRRQR